jgi:3-hydroxy acid dehydrogenase / malonic semialdehyde reductase
VSRIIGKTALVTGASAGIGLACARRLAAMGAHLVLWARRTERLDAEAEAIRRAHGVDVRTATVDVRDRFAVDQAAAAFVATGAVPDILVNNAGLAAGLDLLHEGDPDDWDRMIDTNIKGLLYVTRAFLPHMVERGRGHVVNLGSLAGHQTYPRGNVYGATKYAVRALTESMALDLVGTPIRVSSVSPGLVETEFSVVRFAGDAERAKAVYRGMRPLTADEVAEVIGYVVDLPEHINVLDVVLMPAAQRSTQIVHRES